MTTPFSLPLGSVTQAPHVRDAKSSSLLRGVGLSASLFVGFGLVLFANTAFAAGGGHGEGHHATISSLIPFWINFIIYAALMGYLLKKPVVNTWQSRRATIKESFDSAARVYDSAQSAFVAAESQFQKLQSDIQKLNTEVRAEIERECAVVARDAVAQAERIVLQARDTVTAEQNVQRATIRKNFIEKVMSEAATRAKVLVTPERDVALRAKAVGNAKRAIS